MISVKKIKREIGHDNRKIERENKAISNKAISDKAILDTKK